jgi:NADH-quinone oxidoreductase subunit J
VNLDFRRSRPGGRAPGGKPQKEQATPPMDELSLLQLKPFLFWTIAALTALCALAVVVSQNIVRSATWLLFTLGGTSGVFFLLGADFVGATQLLVYVGGTLVLVIFGVMLTAQGPFITMKTSAAEWAISVTVGLLLLAVLTVSALTSGASYRLPKTVAEYTPGKKEADAAKKKQAEDAAKKAAKEDKTRSADDKAKEHAGHADKKHDKKEHDHSAEKKHEEEVARKPAETVPAFNERTSGSRQTDVLGLGFLGIGVGPAHNEGSGPVRAHYYLPFIIVSVHLLVVLIGAAYLARAKRRRRTAS